MKNFIWAFIISIAIHFILLFSFSINEVKKKERTSYKNNSTKYTNIQLASIKIPKPIKNTKEFKKVQKRVIPKKTKKQKIIKQTINKDIKVVKKKIQKSPKKTIKKRVYKKVVKKDIKIAKRKSVFTKEKPINPPLNKKDNLKEKVLQKNETKPIKDKKTIKKIKKQKDITQTLNKDIKVIKKELKELKRIENIQKEYKAIQKLDKLTQSYIKLYGQEYFNFSETVKKYLKENLNEIGYITQQYLRYPAIAIRTRQHGTTVIQFFLKPNGDIADLKVINSSNYQTLDKNTIKTIKIAYKDYPRPKEITKIIIYVKYIL